MTNRGPLPETFGIVGVGTMTSAIVRGLMKATSGKSPHFVLGPRNAEKAAQIAREFPGSVRVAGSNQEAVNDSKCVILGVLGPQADEVMRELTFREDHKVLSVVAALKLDRLRELAAPAKECAKAIPLPGVAKLRGATVYQGDRFCDAIFSALGTAVWAESEEEFTTIMCCTGLMGDFCKRQLTCQQWMMHRNVDAHKAASYVGAIFATMSAETEEAHPTTLQHLVGEQTAGGLNEMVWKDQEADGSYDSLTYALDSIRNRMVTGKVDQDLAPAKKRAKI